MDTATFALIPGAGGMASNFGPLVPLLERAGHAAIAVDLPGNDPRVGLRDQADLVVKAIGDRTNVILVALSLGGFTAPLVCDRASVASLVFLNAMIPLPGETAGAWWGNTGAVGARRAAALLGGYAPEFDVQTYFLHDIPDAVLKESPPPRAQAEGIFKEPCAFERWPGIPIHVVASRGDRFFPLAFQAKVARDRLGKDVEAIDGSHLAPMSNPGALAEHLGAIARSL